MQKSFKINSSLSSYEVEIGISFAEKILNIPNRNTILICDEGLLKHYEFLRNFKQIVPVVANEESKDLSKIGDVISKLKSLSLKRGDLLVGVGGGVIQDITCFVASIYMRGVDWYYAPTTFLGMCDSCVGGKSSINVNGVKNLVGNFYPPQKIFIDFAFAASLDKEQIDSGICEAIKICYAAPDRKALHEFLKIYRSEKNILPEIAALTLETKKWFIEVDEFDNNERQLLNFGHTFGHAIEAVAQYAIPHGIAVGFGMLWALNFSLLHHKIKESAMEDVNALHDVLVNILQNHKNLCATLKNLPDENLLEKFTHDKKHKTKNYVAILLNEEGFLYKAELSKDASFASLFKESFENMKSIF